jgi:hypothetical protein
VQVLWYAICAQSIKYWSGGARAGSDDSSAAIGSVRTSEPLPSASYLRKAASIWYSICGWQGGFSVWGMYTERRGRAGEQGKGGCVHSRGAGAGSGGKQPQ